MIIMGQGIWIRILVALLLTDFTKIASAVYGHWMELLWINRMLKMESFTCIFFMACILKIEKYS